ncbi:protein of unknown function (plasmid) [Cupriavidus taiwanensis]|nr:protein of unknown function [Cupriavidus taiwanensis]
MDGSRNRRGGRQYGKLHFLSAPCVTPPSKTSTSPSQLATASGGRSLNDVLTSKTSSKHAFQTPLPVIQVDSVKQDGRSSDNHFGRLAGMIVGEC